MQIIDEKYEPDHVYVVKCPPCPMCKKQATVEVPAEGLFKYNQGAHIQTAFHAMSADQRELLITGTHPKCWDKMWS